MPTTQALSVGDAGRPLVSAVIPTRKRPDLVCRAVRSALTQTYPNVEAVVVIDGPDAATVAALKRMDDPRIRIVALEGNVGGSEARNIGVREARGELVALLDDDDEWLPAKLEKQVNVLLSLSARAVVTCRHLMRTPNRPDIALPRRLPLPGEKAGDYLFRADGAALPVYGPQTSTYVAYKSLFISIPFRKGLACHQDWDWFVRAMSEADVRHVMVDEALSVFHVSVDAPGITKRTGWKQSLSWIDSVRDMVSSEAYSSFIAHQVMYRCGETNRRLIVFWTLLGKARRAGALPIMCLLVAAKWLVFSPLRRRLIKDYIRKVIPST